MSAATQETELIFVPLTMLSHLAPAIHAANLLTRRDKTLAVTFLIMKLPKNGPVSLFIKNNSSTNNPRIAFVELEPDEPTFLKLMMDPTTAVRRLIESQKCLVRDHVAEKMEAAAAAPHHEKPRKIGGLVVDMMLCADMIDVADEFSIPAYVFFICSASGLGLWLHLQAFADGDERKSLKEYEDSDFEISPPTHLNPVPAKLWPDLIFEGDGAFFLDTARKFRKAKGIVVNTFLELETRAFKSLSGDLEIPPVYPVGPILHVEREESKENEKKHKEIVAWLDEQPNSSVVYICFGSAGCFEQAQLKEIAVALENSGQRFLWSLRKPPCKEAIDFLGEYEDPREVLPLGFLDRTEGVGKIIGWAPQMAVLSHRAVGGFVSHCGWNSVLESVWCGVPMAAWPLFSDQQVNAFQLVKEYEVAVEIKIDYRKDGDVIVGSETIERAVRELMGPESEGIRVRVAALKERSRAAVAEGGASYEFLGKWIDEVVNL